MFLTIEMELALRHAGLLPAGRRPVLEISDK